MRRLHGGLLAAALVLGAGCSSGPASQDAAPAPVTRPPTLAVSTRDLATAPAGERLSVLVTSPDGLGSPGLDAAVEILLELPDLELNVVSPAGPGGVRALEASTGPATATTASGYPVTEVDATGDQVVATAIEQLGIRPDLVLIGLTPGVWFGPDLTTSPIAAMARGAVVAGIPALGVAVGTEHGADLAAAGVMLRSLFDAELDAVLAPGARVLDVPSCDNGLVSGPVFVDPAAEAPAVMAPDCSQPATGSFGDDVSAYGSGVAALVDTGF